MAPAALAVERSIESKYLNDKTFVRPILDIGCGDGVFAAAVFEEKIDTGIDFDVSEIERAKQYDAYSELLVCPAHKIPKKHNSYGTIFSNSVLEHIPELMPVLKEARRLLKPGDIFTLQFRQTALSSFKHFRLYLENWV